LNQKGAADANNTDDGAEPCTTDDTTQGLGREHVTVDTLKFVRLEHINSKGIS